MVEQKKNRIALKGEINPGQKNSEKISDEPIAIILIVDMWPGTKPDIDKTVVMSLQITFFIAI